MAAGHGEGIHPPAPCRDYKSEFDMDSHRRSEVRGAERKRTTKKSMKDSHLTPV